MRKAQELLLAKPRLPSFRDLFFLLTSRLLQLFLKYAIKPLLALHFQRTIWVFLRAGKPRYRNDEQ